MSASKFLHSGNLLFRSSKTHKSIAATPLFLSFKPLSLLPSFSFHRHCSSSTAAIDAVTSDASDTLKHPWPEWVSFIDRLKSKGYFGNTSSTDTTTTNIANDAIESVYKDTNQLKDPCLSFARDRYDLLKLLSVDDIETVVKNGCPSLLRKVVNSAKRLRAYTRLDEGDVCSACNLRGSCDRAYVLLKDNEADARTVDIVRILLSYALDPLVISEEEKPPGRAVVEASVRKLVSDLIDLIQTTPDPPVQKPAAKAVHQKEQERSFSDSKQPPQSDAVGSKRLSQDVEMKRGDWMCPKCNFMNFSKNIRCLKCSEGGPKKVDVSDIELKKGDWICSKCDFMNFSRNIRCLKCKAEGPKRDAVNDIEMKKGDWNCPQCEFMNFASNKSCLRCQEVRPKRPLNPGDWECPSCDFLNFSRNAVCRKCKCERPKGATTEYEEQIWRRPH
ncbi:zinc finger protein VAR3, chloroplastic [Ricinus communis]|uniref:zinc finger protein VAR3, chloroplastic n=1 Tax=Ricinus communis TaxID=3988 RepID=UPI00201AF609|nr:zinc finger protein VAR3, chloroplastic [Ricinus communis]